MTNDVSHEFQLTRQGTKVQRIALALSPSTTWNSSERRKASKCNARTISGLDLQVAHAPQGEVRISWRAE